jgi:hypothetical protein
MARTREPRLKRPPLAVAATQLMDRLTGTMDLPRLPDRSFTLLPTKRCPSYALPSGLDRHAKPKNHRSDTPHLPKVKTGSRGHVTRG